MSEDLSGLYAAPLRPHDLLGSNNRLPFLEMDGDNRWGNEIGHGEGVIGTLTLKRNMTLYDLV
jgi:hypothetical protein